MKRFIFDSILDEKNICNLKKEKHQIMKLEDDAVVYKEDTGYILADPLLKQHILEFRL